ncbi:hypothetical protein J1N35_018642 [Gossypium stocksii]|uniref:Uncharacterized protein n=1 Tax=Gossypium stocksii TaxID=47602 RepID=A0A9D3VRD8_9ROSI|nr:hypothetical protein J1N35_018642 [Gossypium stocksii]
MDTCIDRIKFPCTFCRYKFELLKPSDFYRYKWSSTSTLGSNGHIFEDFYQHKSTCTDATNDYEVWRVITNVTSISKKKIDGVIVTKEENDWDDVDIKTVQLNAKAMHTLFCAFGPNEYNRVFLCDNAKEIVNEFKISLFTLDYELFKATPDEGIKKMFNHFINIINGLKALRKTYAKKDVINHNAQETKKAQKKVEATFKFTTHEKNDESINDDEEEEIVMFARKFKKFMKFNKAERFPWRDIIKGESSKKENDPIICYECKNPVYIKSECLQ